MMRVHSLSISHCMAFGFLPATALTVLLLVGLPQVCGPTGAQVPCGPIPTLTLRDVAGCALSETGDGLEVSGAEDIIGALSGASWDFESVSVVVLLTGIAWDVASSTPAVFVLTVCWVCDVSVSAVSVCRGGGGRHCHSYAHCGTDDGVKDAHSCPTLFLIPYPVFCFLQRTTALSGLVLSKYNKP